MSLETDLYDFVGRELHELAWTRNYPINPNVGLRAMLEAFRNHGFEVINNIEKKTATFIISPILQGSLFSFETQLTYDEIFNGWKYNPQCCPRSFYDSIYLVYDKIAKQMMESGKSRNECSDWDNIRNADGIRLRENMEKLWLPWFMRNHENMLMPTSGKIPKLTRPKIIHQVLSDFPIQGLRDAIVHRPERGPVAETILERDWENWEFDPTDYHPSESTMMDLFWGMYLKALAKEKGYKLEHEKNHLRELVSGKGEALKEGRHMTWKFSE